MIRTLLAFLATVAASLQIWFIIKTGEAFCLSDGCSIVERLTTVPPLYFYGCGALFFFLVFLASLYSKITESEGAERIVSMLLTAGIAAEGVLLFFQYSIAHAFCSSCLIVLGCIVLLNLLSGFWQLFRGITAFAAVVLACFALQFASGGGAQPLSSGTMAEYREDGNEGNILLIFSESCPYCEEVIEFLREESYCNIAFNPYEKVEKFEFAGAEKMTTYDPAATRNFMKTLGLGSFPLLLAPRDNGGMEILQGKTMIIDYLKKHCRIEDEPVGNSSTGQSRLPQKDDFTLPETKASDSCSETSDC